MKECLKCQTKEGLVTLTEKVKTTLTVEGKISGSSVTEVENEVTVTLCYLCLAASLAPVLVTGFDPAHTPGEGVKSVMVPIQVIDTRVETETREFCKPQEKSNPISHFQNETNKIGIDCEIITPKAAPCNAPGTFRMEDIPKDEPKTETDRDAMLDKSKEKVTSRFSFLKKKESEPVTDLVDSLVNTDDLPY